MLLCETQQEKDQWLGNSGAENARGMDRHDPCRGSVHFAGFALVETITCLQLSLKVEWSFIDSLLLG